MSDALEPLGDMRDEESLGIEVVGDFAFVDVVCHGIGDEIVTEETDVVLRGGFGACARVAGDTEDGWGCGDEFEEGGDADLGGGGIASWV